jgi:hypothetical protein
MALSPEAAAEVRRIIEEMERLIKLLPAAIEQMEREAAARAK